MPILTKLSSIYTKNDDTSWEGAKIMVLSEKSSPNWATFQRKFDDKRPVLFTLVGLPGSGKSYLADGIALTDGNVLVKPTIHSSDEIRKELFGDVNDQQHNEEVFNTLHQRIKDDLAAGKDVIYDATNLYKKKRSAFLQELKYIPCQKVCILMLTPYAEILRQNAERERVVPESVIRRMYLNFCPPSLQEGFDDIILAYHYGSIDRGEFSLYNFLHGEINACNISQQNEHHTYSIGDHCSAAAQYIADHYPGDDVLYAAAMLHDVGKVFTKSNLNFKGRVDTNYHYYGHEHCGSYDSFFYASSGTISHHAFTPAEIIDIANLIYYHMRPYTAWKQSEKAKERDRKIFGEKFFNDVLKLHEADKNAH